jgi:steroid delta-isomerase-like uncharacterized protein
MATEENKAIIREVITRAWNGQDFDAMDAVYAPDYVHHDPSLPPEAQRGLANYKQGVRTFYTVFSDLHGEIEELIGEGDKVVARLRWRGTQRGELLGIPPSGKRVDFSMIEIYRFAEGKIAEGWANFDTLGKLQQLGVVPTQGT